MKQFLFLLILVSTGAFAQSAIQEEIIYQNFKTDIESGVAEKSNSLRIGAADQKLFVDALWDSLEERATSTNLSNLKRVNTFHYSLVERLRLAILKLKYKEASKLDTELITELKNELKKPSVELKIIYILAAHQELLMKAGHKYLIKLAKLHDNYSDIAQETEDESEIMAEVVTDLFFNTPDVTTYMGGEYLKSVKIFMFCRQNRLYPCLMVMKDVNDKEVRNSDGTIWSNGALASARTGLPSFQRNGNTPAGIFTIDSVMPEADQQLAYGKFRRMILNFVPKSEDETLIKLLLPKSSWDSTWWKATTVARDIGRNLFRIHGSGRMNTDSTTPYFPFMRTLGCISQRENTYSGVTYKDQRNLLDSIMKSMELAPSYENEPKIKGILYVLELNDKSSPVTLNDLKDYGIN